MTPQILTLAVGLGAFLIAWTLVRLVREAARRNSWFAPVRDDRWHTAPTPHYGGAGIAGAFVAAVAIARGVSDPFRDAGSVNGTLVAALMVGAISAALVGLLDDLFHLRPATKLVGQCSCACLFLWIAGGVEVTGSAPLDSVLVLILIVAAMNAVNMFDNMDGLAATTVAIGLATITIVALATAPASPLPVISAAATGSVLGFLVQNLPTARIFMGDGGSLMLGFLLAALAVTCAREATQTGAASELAAGQDPLLGAVIALGVLWVPAVDMIVVSLARIRRGQSPMEGGRDHTSHRMAARGVKAWTTITLVAAASVVACTIVLLTVEGAISRGVGMGSLLALGAVTVAQLLRVALRMDSMGSAGRADGAHRRAAFAPFVKVVVDVAFVALAVNGAYLLRWGLAVPPELSNAIAWSLPVTIASCVTVNALAGTYWQSWRHQGWVEVRRTVVLSLVATTLALVLIAALWSPDRLFSRLAMAYFVVAYTAGSVVLRAIVGWVLRG